MEVKVKATEKPEKLLKDLKRRGKNAEMENGEITVKTEETSFIEKIPGIKNYTVQGETKEGLKGRPLQEQAYIKIGSREDAAKAFLATMDGYRLTVLDTEREWDLRKLREYNPSIKHLKSSEPVEELGIEKSVGEIEGLEKIGIEISEKEAELVYGEMLT
ncbi:MAG: hypothetical protein ABEJ93_00745 [Candidatus Nanohalobium sp.]